MRVNRREFVAASGAALLPLLGSSRVAAQATRKLFLVAHGLSIIVVGRAPGASGLPGQAPRVDLLFVNNAAHKAPLFFVDNDSIDLDGCELKILVGGAPLPANAVTLTQKLKIDPCPRGDQWLSMSLIPDFEQVLGMPGKVGIDPRCLHATAPRLVRSRMTFQDGILAGGTPNYKYAGQQWEFPGGNKNYLSPFTDTLEWEMSVSATSAVEFQAVEFGSGKVRKTIKINPSATEILAGLNAQPNSPQANTKTIPHFDHYYDLLTYGTKARPIPSLGPAASCPISIFTTEQVDFKDNFQRLKLRFQKPVQEFDEYDQGSGGCDAGDTGTMLRRSEPGICISGIVYHEFK